jgi:hypothetical protein
MTLRSLAALQVYLVFMSWSGSARADDFYQHAVMNCAKKTVWAEITTHGTYNDDPAPEGVSDCVLPGFGPVRLKVGAGPVYAYGAGYGQATMFVSVWVKQAKVVSREKFKCGGEGKCELRIAVTLGGLRVCRKPGDGTNDADSKQPESCTFQAWSDLSMQRDPLEYPIAGEPVRPPNYSVATILARDKKFCAGFVPSSPEARDIELPAGASVVEPASRGNWEWVGWYEFYDLDADNNGSLDRVVHLHARTHAYDADAMFLFSHSTVPEVKVGKMEETHSDAEYAKAADRVFPDSWHEERADIPAPWWNPEDAMSTPHFKIGGFFQPITLNGKTYIIWTTSVGVFQHWKTILEPRPDGSVITQCAFQRVQPEF